MKGIEGLTLGRYELRRRLGQGGMAEVYLAYDRRLRRQVAIKVLYARDESFVRRFEREALSVGALSHNHILPLYDFGEQSPWYYLVMPYVEGSTLRDYLFKRKLLTLEEAISIISQIASALQYAHDHGVVHRDVKPSNILLRQDGYAYLVDFGLAKAITGGESLTTAGAMIGTPEYMAPEQSNGQSDYRSDIYSLGIILYQMLAGRVPFTAESPVAISLKHIQSKPVPPRELNSEIPPSIEEIILKALAKDPDERFQQAQAFADALWQALQQEQAHTQTSTEPTSPSSEVSAEAAETVQKAVIAPSIATQVLPETGHASSHPLITPLLIPLKEPLIEVSSATARHNIRRRTRPRSTLLVLACLASLVIALPLGFMTWYARQSHHGGNTGSQSLGAQQLINADMTATAIAQAQIQATLATQARAQATAGITSAIGAGNVLYADSMAAPGNGWVDDGSQCFFSPPGYHVQTHAAHEAAWCYSSVQSFSNVVITAQAQLLRGDTYGLIFRLSPHARQFYVLELNSLGEYRFVRASGNNPLNWLTLIDWTASNTILKGYDQVNTFLVVAVGSQFSFYINKQLIVFSYVDASGSAYPSGLIGFLVSGDSAGGTEAVFSNVWVFQK
ncbi:MAG TPA: protein kinase [Ktedonobacteraceae bacterium]|jgi:serine/threonine protein kinase|nr:protein kinase [Ktedonobacteraceae bacterium]